MEKIKDSVYRQDAIDAIDVYMNRLCKYIGGHNDTESYAFARGLLVGVRMDIRGLPSAQPDNPCDGCKYENADDGVLVPCGFCKRSHPDNYERRTDEAD